MNQIIATRERTSSVAVEPRAAVARPIVAALVLCWREIIRFLRQRHRVFGALGQPILFWLLFGAGLQRSFRVSDGQGSTLPFLNYYFPGTLILILLFTAIFATISIIEDRREGFLQGVLVAPIPPWSIVLGKVLGGSALAVGQAILFLLLGLIIQVRIEAMAVLPLIGLLLLIAIALTSLGVVIAWRMESTQGFHAIMNLLLMPMWLLSGAFFPVPAVVDGSDWGQVVLHWCMRLNPVTYCVAGVRQMLDDRPLPSVFWQPPSLVACCLITAAFAAVTFFVACRIARQRVSGDTV